MPGAEILLVEDDDLNQALVPAILARSDQPRLRDAHVTVAGTLARAREVLAAQHIDLVLLDMRLPDGSGLPLATELRAQPGSPVAVIALTGAPAEHGDDALAAGCVAVLGKPYSLADLRELVGAHLPQDRPGHGPGVGTAPAPAPRESPAEQPAAQPPAGPPAEPAAGPGGEPSRAPAASSPADVPAPRMREAPAPGPDMGAQQSPGGTRLEEDAPPGGRPARPGPAAVGSTAAVESPVAAGSVAAVESPVAAGSVAAVQTPVAADSPAEAAVDFALLFAALPGMYLVMDPGLRILAVSDAYALATRADPAALLGRRVADALPEDADSPPPGALPGLHASLDRVRISRSAEVMEVQKRFIPPPEVGGGIYEACYFKPVNVPVLDARGTLCYVIHALQDVTGYMAELEQARQGERAAREAKTEYVNRVSHELRTPVNTIVGFGELLSLGDLSAEHREWAAMMTKAARHLAAFVDDIADISRAEMHKLSVSIEPVPVGAVLADALDLIRPLAASHGVHLDPPPPAAQYVSGDPRRLRQVLLNLLSNAVKYNHPAGRVSVGVQAQPGDRLRISVRDTGRGIADYDIGQLFTPFQRLDAAQAGIEGAGLGLTLSRQLIEAMGGTIGAASAPGEGSVFWLDLPVTQPPVPADAATGADPVVEPRAYTAPKTILYVEDMLETLLLVEHILNQRPSTSLVPAMLGGAALDLAAEYRPHLILLDLNLPDIPGEELLRRLKTDPATSATPVVIISADAATERRDSLLAMGASAYLAKPIGVRDFLRTVDALLTAPQPAAADGDGAPVAEPQPGQP